MTKWLTTHGYPATPAKCSMATADSAPLTKRTGLVLGVVALVALVAVPLAKSAARAKSERVADMS